MVPMMRGAVGLVLLAGLGAGPALAAPDDIDQALGTNITISFSSTPLEDALEGIRDASRLNLVVDPSVASSELRVSAESSGGSVKKLLDQLLSQTKLTSSRWCGVLLLHPADTKPPAEPETGKDDPRLTATTSVAFQRTPLAEALERLKSRNKVESFLPSRVRARMRQESESVSLRLWSVEVRHVLTHLARACGLTWSLAGGKVEFALAGGADRQVDASQLRDVDLREGLKNQVQQEDVRALAMQLGDPTGREGAMRRLVAVGEAAVPEVVQRLSKADGPTAVAALRVLGRIGAGQEDLILKVLTDVERTLEVRTAAGQALGALKAEKAIPTLIELLDDKWFKISETARASLVQIGAPAVAPLRKRYTEERDKAKNAKEGLIYRALLVFGSIPDDAARSTLLEALKTTRGPRAVPLRHHAAIGLGFTGDHKMIEPLIEALSEERQFLVAKYIARSLNWLTDAELPPQPETWRTWWKDNRDKFGGKKGSSELDDLSKPLEPDFGTLPKIGKDE